MVKYTMKMQKLFKLSLMLGIMLFLIFFISYMAFSGMIKNCDKYSNYGYVVEYPNYIDWFGEGMACYIIMEDGTKVASYVFNSSDFKIADYKKPKQIISP